MFVGSPVGSEEKEIQRLAKKLKKEKVNVDIVNFGEAVENLDKLTGFINTLNGKEGTGEEIFENIFQLQIKLASFELSKFNI